MTALEEKEIKGVTVKLLYAIIVSTVVMVASVMGAYYGLKGQNDLTQLQVDVLKAQVGNIEIDQKELRQRIEKLEAK